MAESPAKLGSRGWYDDTSAYPERYGPLQDGFTFDLQEGYQVLVGANDSGKSSSCSWPSRRCSIRRLRPGRSPFCSRRERGSANYLRRAGQTLINYNTPLFCNNNLASTIMFTTAGFAS